MNSGDPIYYDDIAVLWKNGRFNELWPSVDMTTAERVNAIVRFCACTGLALYVARKGDDRFLLYALTGIAIVTMAYRFHAQRDVEEKFKQTYRGVYNPPGDVSADVPTYTCQPPTVDNPFGNFLPTDDPNRPPACQYDDVKDDIKRNFDDLQYRDVTDLYGASRNLYTMPVTTAGPDTEEFIKFAYGDLIHSQKNRYVQPW